MQALPPEVVANPICSVCAFIEPDLREKRKPCRILNDSDMGKLAGVAREVPVQMVKPPLIRGENGFESEYASIFSEEPWNSIMWKPVSRVSHFPSPFQEQTNRNGLIPLKLVETMVVETACAHDGDLDRVATLAKKVMNEEELAENIEDIQSENVNKRKNAAKKVAVAIVKEALKAKPAPETGLENFYAQLNLAPRSATTNFMEEFWLKRDGLANVDWIDFHYHNRANRQILALIGSKGNWTPWHIDWTSAINVAFGISGVDISKPLARWYFVHPAAILKVDQWIKMKYGIEAGLRCGKDAMPYLKDDDFSELQKYCGNDPAGRPYVWVELQFHGEWFEFEPGLLHQVETLQPSIKFAWDVYKADKLKMYLQVWMYIICQFMAAPTNAEDYMNIVGLILSDILNPWYGDA